MPAQRIKLHDFYAFFLSTGTVAILHHQGGYSMVAKRLHLR